MHTLNNPDLVDHDGDPPHENDSPTADTDANANADADSANTIYARLSRLEDQVRFLASTQATEPHCASCCRSQDPSSPSSHLTQLAEAKVVECEVLRSALAVQAARVSALQEEIAERAEGILKEKKEVKELREENEALTEMLANREADVKSITADIVGGARRLNKLQADQLQAFRVFMVKHDEAEELHTREAELHTREAERHKREADFRRFSFSRSGFLEPVVVNREEGIATLKATIEEHEDKIQRLVDGTKRLNNLQEDLLLAFDIYMAEQEEVEEVEEVEKLEKLEKIAKEREGEFRRTVYVEPVAVNRAEDITKLEATIEEHEDKIRRLQRLLEEQMTETMDAQRERDEIKKEVKDRDEQIIELGASVEHFKTRIEENHELILDLSASAEVYRSKVEDFEKDNEVRERELRELEELLELQETQSKATLTNVVADKDGMIREFESEIVLKSERIGELEDNIEDLENFVGALEDEIKQLQARLDQRDTDPVAEHKKAQAAAKDEMIAELLDQVSVKNEKIADLEESVTVKDERMSRLGTIVEGLESELRWLQDVLAERVMETETARKEAELAREAQPRASRLEQQAEDLRTQLDALRLNDFNHARDIERLQREVADKDAQIVNMAGLIIKYQDEAARFRGEIKSVGRMPEQGHWYGGRASD